MDHVQSVMYTIIMMRTKRHVFQECVMQDQGLMRMANVSNVQDLLDYPKTKENV